MHIVRKTKILFERSLLNFNRRMESRHGRLKTEKETCQIPLKYGAGDGLWIFHGQFKTLKGLAVYERLSTIFRKLISSYFGRITRKNVKSLEMLVDEKLQGS